MKIILFDCTGAIKVICDTVCVLGLMAMVTCIWYFLFGRK